MWYFILCLKINAARNPRPGPCFTSIQCRKETTLPSIYPTQRSLYPVGSDSCGSQPEEIQNFLGKDSNCMSGGVCVCLYMLVHAETWCRSWLSQCNKIGFCLLIWFFTSLLYTVRHLVKYKHSFQNLIKNCCNYVDVANMK